VCVCAERDRARETGERREMDRRRQQRSTLLFGPLCPGLGHLGGLLLLSVRLIGGVVGRRPLNSSSCEQRRRRAPVAVAELRRHSNAGNFCLILFTVPCTSRRIIRGGFRDQGASRGHSPVSAAVELCSWPLRRPGGRKGYPPSVWE
jgi:hypothetical protein